MPGGDQVCFRVLAARLAHFALLIQARDLTPHPGSGLHTISGVATLAVEVAVCVVHSGARPVSKLEPGFAHEAVRLRLVLHYFVVRITAVTRLELRFVGRSCAARFAHSELLVLAHDVSRTHGGSFDHLAALAAIHWISAHFIFVGLGAAGAAQGKLRNGRAPFGTVRWFVFGCNLHHFLVFRPVGHTAETL